MADELDYLDLFSGDEPTARNQAAALANAIRGRRADAQNRADLSSVLAFSGDPAISAAGKQIGATGENLLGEAARQEQGLVGAAQHRAQQQIEQKRLENQTAQLQAMMGYRQGELEARNRGLDQADARLAAYERALALRGVRYNPNTGQFENIGGMAGGGGKGAGGVLPGATSAAGGGPPPGPRRPVPAAPPAGTSPAPGGAAVPGAVPGGLPGPVPSGPPMAGKMLQEALGKFGQDFDPNGGRAGEMGKNQARVNAATRLLQLATDENGNAKDLNPQQMPELSQALASLISGGGQGAMAQIEHLTPHSMSGDAAKIAQWITNEPHGAGQQAFVQNMIETAKRERTVAGQAVQQAAMQRLGKHQVLISRNPKEAQLAADRYGYELDPATLTIKPKGLGGGATAASPEDLAAKAWLAANPNHPRAAAIAAKLQAKGL